MQRRQPVNAYGINESNSYILDMAYSSILITFKIVTKQNVSALKDLAL